MKPAKPPPPRDANEEIAALIETLHQTGQRLEELTAGEVDTVADRDGRTFLLRHAQEQLRHNEAAKQAAILNALPAHIAMLDTQGRIISVNAAWREFATANSLQGPEYGIGVNYLAICDSALGADAAEARQVAAGIRSVLSAGSNSFSLEYPCHSPSEKRWFLMNVIPLAADHLHGAVVVHLNITERKQSEQALHESELELRAIFDSAVDGILVGDTETRKFVNANIAICNMLGYTHEEILRIGVLDIHPKQYLPFAMEHLGRLLRGETQFAIDIPMLRKDGSVFYVSVKASHVRLGDKDCVVAVYRDITERKRAEQELLESELRFRQIAENIRDVFFLRDADNSRVLYISPAYEEIWGRSCESVYANPRALTDSIHPDDLAAARQNFHNEMSMGKFELEYRIVRPDGSLRWIQSKGFPVLDNAGKIVRIAGVATDITERKLAEQNLRESERRFSDMLANVQLISMTLDREGRITYCNEYLLRLTGWRHEEVIGRNWFDAFAPPEINDLKGDFFATLIANMPEALHHENEILTRSGERRLIRWNNSVLRSGAGDVIGTASIGEDITERKAAHDRILRLNRIYAVLSGINSLIVRVHDRDQLFEKACRIAVEQGSFRMAWVGLIDADGITVTPVAKAGVEEGYLDNIQLSAIQDTPNGCQMVARALQEGVEVVCNDIGTEPQMARWRDEALRRGYRSVAVFPLRVGEKMVGLLLLYASEVDFFDKEETGLLTELTGDISFALDHIEKEKRLNYLAYYDVLTELPNRTLFYERLTQGIALAGRNEWRLVVLSVDLDNFKTISNTLGHGIGDTLLHAVGRRLAACLDNTDTLGQLGGNEFGIIVPEIGNSEDAAIVARKVIESCQKPYLVDGHELFVSASVGITLFPDDDGDSETLVSNASKAMHRAKDLGRNTYQFFTAEMNQNSQAKMQLEADLRYALDRGEFLLHYQPQLSCVNGKITGFEALLRWQHPQRGLVGPDGFIPALEETGLIVPVGEWVLTTACAQAKSWHDAGLGTPSMAVNISGQQIHLTDLCETVRAALAASGLTPAHLELELTESQLMKDAEGIIGLLRRLKTMGVSLSVDDFGTGYSSLAYLKRFPIDNLKVDRAFIRDIIADTDDVSITRAIITLAHNLKLKVVAEGVETEGQLGMLIANHCDEMQGYYFSRPLPAEEATALLRSGRTLDSRMLAGMRRNRTLLLVDDEANILSALKRLLRHDGYDILTALSAEQGLELLASHPVDVIVSDQRMPGMSGVEFLRRVKTLHPETVRLVLSGYTDLQAVTDAINEGAIYKFLTKPWDDGILRANIEEAFRNKEMADENLRMRNELALANAQLQKLLASKQQSAMGDKDQGRPHASGTGGSG